MSRVRGFVGDGAVGTGEGVAVGLAGLSDRGDGDEADGRTELERRLEVR